MKRFVYSAVIWAAALCSLAGVVRDGGRAGGSPSPWRRDGFGAAGGAGRWVAGGFAVGGLPVGPAACGPSLPMPVEWYALEDGAASAVVLDSSGQGGHAALFAGNTEDMTVAGVDGNGLRVGVGNMLVSAAPAACEALSSEAWTISFWCRRDAATSHAELLGFGGMPGWFYYNHDNSTFFGAVEGVAAAFSHEMTWGAGEWKHVVVRRDGSDLTVFFNAVPAGTSGGVAAPVSAVTSFSVGGLGAEYADPRSVDDVRVYDVALSGEAVAALFAGYPPAPPPPPPPTYVCTLDCDGGFLPEEESYLRDVVLGQAYGYLPAPGREGYTFGGWYSYDLNDYVYDVTAVSLTYDHTLVAYWY